MNTYCFLIKGKVQGVGFRFYTESFAHTQNFNGYVQNLPDGSVQAVFNLEETQIDFVKEALQKGPPLSDVTEVTYDKMAAQDFDHFSIRH